MKRIVGWFWDDGIPTGLGILTVAVAFLVAVIGFVAWAEQRSCINQAEVMEREWEWRVFGGCLVQGDDGHWYPPENIREAERR